MADGREFELKLETDHGALPALRDHPLLQGKSLGSKRTVSVYHDTRKGALRDAGVTLRVRRSGDAYVQTIKAGGAASAGLFDRPEWEEPLTGPDPDLALAKDTALAPLLAGGGIKKQLRPVFETAVERHVWQLVHDGAAIELILDEGEVVAGKRREPLVEIELELQSGTPEGLFSLARELGATVPLRLGVLTKSERGDRLARGRNAKVAKAEPVRLDAGMNGAAAFQAVAFACLRHFRLNEALAARERDPAALHQCRVALRRLRSALSMFRRLVADERLGHFRAAFRSAAASLGEARDLDVFLGRRSDSIGHPAKKALKAQREAAYDRVALLFDGAEFRALMLEFVEWVASGPWTRAEGPPPLLRELPAPELAGKILDRFWKRVRRGGRVLAELPEEARHEVRIEAKKLRYATEFFAGLYEGPKKSVRRDAFLAALERLQGELGDLNDLATGRALTEKLSRQAGIALAPEPAGQADATPGLVAAAAKAVAELDAIKPFWR